MTIGISETTKKLIEFWDRRDTAGFYELEELVSSLLSSREKEIVEHIKLCAKEQSCSMCMEFLGKK